MKLMLVSHKKNLMMKRLTSILWPLKIIKIEITTLLRSMTLTHSHAELLDTFEDLHDDMKTLCKKNSSKKLLCFTFRGK